VSIVRGLIRAFVSSAALLCGWLMLIYGGSYLARAVMWLPVNVMLGSLAFVVIGSMLIFVGLLAFVVSSD
jgi:hypothetical protein